MRRLVFLALTLLVAASFAAFSGQTPVGAQPAAIQVVAISGNSVQVSAGFNTDEQSVTFSVSDPSGVVTSLSLVSCSHAVAGNCTSMVPDTDGSAFVYNSGTGLQNVDANATNDSVTFVVSVTLNCNLASSASVVAQQGGLSLSAPVNCGSSYNGSAYNSSYYNNYFTCTNGFYPSGYLNNGYLVNGLYNGGYPIYGFNGYLNNGIYSNGLVANPNCVASYAVSDQLTPNNFLYLGSGYSCGYYTSLSTACSNSYYYQDPSPSAAITAPVAVLPATNILAVKPRSGAVNGINGTDATKRNFAYAAQQAAAAQAAAAQAAAIAAAQAPRVVAPNTGEVGLADPQYPFVTFYSEIPADQMDVVVATDDTGAGNPGE